LVDAPGHVEFETQHVTHLPSAATYSLRIVDAASGQAIESSSVGFRLRIAPLWSSTMIYDDPLQTLLTRTGEQAPIALLVGKRGYVPALLDVRSALGAARREPRSVEIELRLERGFGAGLIVLDAEHCGRAQPWTARQDDWRFGSRWSWRSLGDFLPMGGLEGARIVSAGVTIGTSDATGLALCRSDRSIEPFEVALEGWTMLDVMGFRGHDDNPWGLGFVFMVRE
jgi:hypothetical protein